MECLVAKGMYWPISFCAEGPSPGKDVTNLRMLVGLCAKAHALPLPSVWYIAAPAPASAAFLRKSRRLFAMCPPFFAQLQERQAFPCSPRIGLEACCGQLVQQECTTKWPRAASSRSAVQQVPQIDQSCRLRRSATHLSDAVHTLRPEHVRQ